MELESVDQTSDTFTALIGQTPTFLKRGTGRIHFVNGVPPATLGANGDFAFRYDGVAGANTTIYHKEAGAWIGLTA